MEEFEKLNDANLRQRIADLKDVDNAILQGLGVEINNKIELPEDGIVVVKDITPGQVSELDITKVKGVICLENGPTSHSSILLKSRGIPAVIQAQYNKESLESLPPSTLLILNGETGEIWVNPDEEKKKELTDLQQKYINEQIENKKESLKPAFTLDNQEIKVYANIGRLEDSEMAVENGADGSGLLRTEFMFLDRQQAPSEEEQIEILRQLLTPLKGKPVIIRTLDAGGDKNIPYLNIPKEDNPYLGIRAIRLCLMKPELFLEQLKAILRIGAEFKDIKIMFPFISQLRELQEAKKYLNQAHEMLQKEGKEHLWKIDTGMMMEIPSAAIMAEDYMEEIDFLSIGTNDLTQYTLAADRGNPALIQYAGKELDGAVLKLIAHIVEEANKKNVSVSVCGEAASVPESASKLIGLGITSLSMSVYAIPAMKKWIREQNQ
ncbi:MAG: phosphoenolpyruvate--protein phosphotransferase, partial [Odoribacter sp.]|nr:phosphoenolpyruvate--protein phosphotransferase [Odoribacter sp.]